MLNAVEEAGAPRMTSRLRCHRCDFTCSARSEVCIGVKNKDILERFAQLLA